MAWPIWHIATFALEQETNGVHMFFTVTGTAPDGPVMGQILALETIVRSGFEIFLEDDTLYAKIPSRRNVWFHAEPTRSPLADKTLRESLALSLWDGGLVRPEWLAREVVNHVLDHDALSGVLTRPETS